MSINLKLASVLEKNKLAASTPWLVLLDIELDPINNPSDVLRLVGNNEDIIFQGHTYTAFNFAIDAIPTKSNSELPQVQLSVSNVNRTIQGEIETHSGAVDATVIISLLETGHLTGDPDLEFKFVVISTLSDDQVVTFTLGASNPLRQPFPFQFYQSNYCRHRYNTPEMQDNLDPAGAMCNYQGNLTTCSKLLNGDNGCRAHNNLINFGGEPSIDATGYRRALA